MENKLNTDETRNISNEGEGVNSTEAPLAKTDVTPEGAQCSGTTENEADSANADVSAAADNADAATMENEPIQEEFIIPDSPFALLSQNAEPENIVETAEDEPQSSEVDEPDDGDAECDTAEVGTESEIEPDEGSDEEVRSTCEHEGAILASAESVSAPAVSEPHIPYKEERYAPEKPRKIDVIFDFLELFVFTLVAVLIVTTFFVRHSVVDGDSMLNTLHDGDTLIISDLFYEPARGDIIVIESTELGKAIVKRVIAIGGDEVRVTPTGIYVNGAPLNEPYVYTDGEEYTYDLHRYGKLRDNPTFKAVPGSHFEFVVPEGEVFVMGDHRSDSKDSRDLGTLPVEAILGRVLWRVLPFDSFGAIK